ncbi:MAG: putative sigma-54 modulation protein [Cognaticolwellia sp.]|jgi:putative sigma-54 modulation protein
MKVQTQSIHFDADVKLTDFIEQRLEKLERFYDQIIMADVMLKLENSGQVRDKVAEIKLKVPGSVLIAKETDKSFEAAIDSSVEALRRQLIKHKERLRS